MVEHDFQAQQRSPDQLSLDDRLPEPIFVIPEIDAAALRRAREIARAAKKQRWWLEKRNSGVCHYCGERFPPRKLSMDHIVPLCRGGRTTPGNVVAACMSCNRSKDALTPAEIMLSTSADER